MASPIIDESKGPSGTLVYGFEPSSSPKEAYNGFIDTLKIYDANGNIEKIQDFLNMNKN
ncbi:hypothetical protein JFL43_01750 [Viridibacillus sp. YIM B01967]|uniref:Uncharacterized protein n=1 Tax=Viridibacillus soli TaxID=2798301 RepID=A0ABS1H2H1_9BACL|nr:hypothetical protein [Viridibacillus soli]